MKTADYARLLGLAAIWGASFMFQRVASPVLGAAWTAEARLLLAGLVLAAWFHFTGFDPQWRRHGRQYFAIGLVNMALPSLLYAYALVWIPASLAAILNSTSPMFGALFGALLLGERMGLRKLLGCATGAAGVALVARPGGFTAAFAAGDMFWVAVAACIAACICYGYTGVVMRRYAAGTPSRGIAAGGQLAGAVLLLPLLPFSPPPGEPTLPALASLAALAVLGNALGMVLYFRLINDVGMTRALTVTYLMPAFALLWGMLFLGESLTMGALAGAVLILARTALVTRG